MKSILTLYISLIVIYSQPTVASSTCAKIHTKNMSLDSSGGEQTVYQLAQLRMDLDLRIAAGERGLIVSKLEREFNRKFHELAEQSNNEVIKKRIYEHILVLQGKKNIRDEQEREVREVENRFIRINDEMTRIAEEHQGWNKLIEYYHSHSGKDQIYIRDEIASWANLEPENTVPSNKKYYYLECAKRSFDFLKILSESPVFDINARLYHGKTLLHHLVRDNGNLDKVEYLLNRSDLDLSTVTDGVKLPFWIASSNANEMNQYLNLIIRSQKFDLNEKDITGNTVAMRLLTTPVSDLQTVNLILNDKNIRAEDVNSSGDTLLHLAAQYGASPEVIQALLNDPRFDINAQNKYGMTAINRSITSGSGGLGLQLKTLMSDSRLNLNASSVDNNPILQYLEHFAYKAHEQYFQKHHIYEFLVKKTENVNATDAYGVTILMHAIKNGHSSHVAELLKREDLDILASTGVGGKTRTALDFALENPDTPENRKIVKALLSDKRMPQNKKTIMLRLKYFFK